jgi:prepilin-type N-terminal cleavage/methylation domain-containing protein
MIQIANHHQSKRGFTLGEMLVVLFVFAILAIMFFFSTNTAIVKAKNTRARQEEKDLAKALNWYESEYLDIPTQNQGLSRLKSTLGYMKRIPIDPFNQSSGNREYGYVSDLSDNTRWVIISVGPDGEADVQKAIDDMRKLKDVKQSNSPWPFRQALMTNSEAKEFVTRYSYDPTNGSVSKGDIITLYGE